MGKHGRNRRVLGLAVAAIAAIACAVAPASAAATEAFFEPTAGAMVENREAPAAAPLPGGKVLLAGGLVLFTGTYLDNAEVFASSSGTFSAVAATMTVPRRAAGAAALPGGDVLIVGGRNEGEYLASAEIFGSESETFSVTGSMSAPRSGPAVAALPDGRVLVAGGSEGLEGPLASAEIYDPESGEFAPTGAPVLARENAGAAVLPDGRILITGGLGTSGTLKSAEIFDPETETFSATGSMTKSGYGPAAPLPDGTAVFFSQEFLQIFNSASESFTKPALAALPRTGEVAVPLSGARVLVAAGRKVPGGPPFPKTQPMIYVSAPSPVGKGIDFGKVPVAETSGPETLTITNKGAQALEIEAASLTGPDAAEFEIVADGCSGETLAFGAACSLKISVTPASAGSLSASLQLVDNAPTSPQSFALSAKAE